MQWVEMRQICFKIVITLYIHEKIKFIENQFAHLMLQKIAF